MHTTASATPRWSETTVSWDYPPSPAAYHDALLSRGASHSRFLRIAYSSERERSPSSSTTSISPPDDVHLPPCPPSRSCANVRPRSPNPMSHTLKRRKSQWPKPPHYHASLLRSPLSHRKGLFRTVLPPSKAVDFFRWDFLVAPSHARDQSTSSGVDACPSLHVAESVLEPYEAAAGFFGWHGLGIDVLRRAQVHYQQDIDAEYSQCLGLERDGVRGSRSSSLQLEIDEDVVEEERARWARTADELVGHPGLVLRQVVKDKLGKITLPSDQPHKHVVDAFFSSSFRSEEVRWDPDIGSSPFRPSRVASTKRKSPPANSAVSPPDSSSSSKPEPKQDSPSAWWYAPSPLRGHPPNPLLPSLRFPPPLSVQYAPPPVQFSPWFPGGRVASAQGHGFWYGAQSAGATSSMTHDPNLAKSIPSNSHVFTSPAAPISTHPAQSPPYSTKSGLGRDEYGLGNDCDKETETDHGYESTTTTTDSDPPPHTPVGAATTAHCVEGRLHGDDEANIYEVEIDSEYVAASVTISSSDSATPVKLLGRFSVPTSLSASSVSAGSNEESSKAAVVFPSLNGSFRQGSPVAALSPGMSAQATPVRTATPGSSSSSSSTTESTTQLSFGDEEQPKTKRKSGSLEPPTCSVSGDSPAFTLSLSSPPRTGPRPGLRKDSQGFWEPVTPVSPLSSSSSLPLSPSECKTELRLVAGLASEKAVPAPGESFELPESTCSLSTLSSKSRSLSPDSRRVASAGSTCSSSPRPASFSSPTSAPGCVLGESYSSSPSSPNGVSLVPANPTTLLPAFLATASVKRKRTSRTREIVDRLRSSSIDAGKECAAFDSLDWLASPSRVGEQEGKHGKASPGLGHPTGSHVARGQLSPSPSPSSQSGADSASWVGSNLGKDGQGPVSDVSDASSPGSEGKSSGATQTVVIGTETPGSHSGPRAVTKSGITPFPILSASQTSASNFTRPRQSQTSTGREPATAMPSKSADGTKINGIVATSPSARTSGPQLVPSTPNGGGASPSMRVPLSSPSHPTVHPQPPLGAPSLLAVPPYPHPVYVPFTQYHLAPPHQGQQTQGTWLAVYPGRPPHLPVHPLPAQPHVPPITGMSGMRHVSW